MPNWLIQKQNWPIPKSYKETAINVVVAQPQANHPPNLATDINKIN